MAATCYKLCNKNPLFALKYNSTRSELNFKFSASNLNFIRSFSVQNTQCYDIVIVGGGIVGMATARELSLRHKSIRIAVVEKEKKLAAHQSGHNSGVIHAGIYYKPGTLKAQLCVRGLKLAYKYCNEKGIPYKKCGKLIVATNERENKQLDDLYVRATKNGVADLVIVDGKDIQKYEPNCQGRRAIHSPHTGIVDWAAVTEQYSKDFTENGGDILLNFPVTGFAEAAGSGAQLINSYPVVVKTKEKSIRSRFVLTCGGLHSDVLSAMSGCSAEPRIVPFRGEYLVTKPDKSNIVRGNIYPVPDPRFPFLGVHFTPRMDGTLWLGPNAVLAFGREGYKWSDINLAEVRDILMYRGFRRLALRYLGFGSKEMLKSALINLQVAELQRFVPTLQTCDVVRGPAGVRAQALDRDGQLVDDFVFDIGKFSVGKRILHCRNAPSPGATSSLAIAELVADKVEQIFQIR